MLSKHRKKQKEKVKDAEFDIDIVAKDLEKVINKHIKRKTHGFDIACALADVSAQFIHDTAPSTASAQHILLNAIQQPLQEAIEYEKGEYENE
jgi:galactitol-specific phosphotransferase system IIB component